MRIVDLLMALNLAVVLAMCSTPKHPIDGPGPQPIIKADGGATCEDMCDHLTELGCPEAEPTPGGHSCEFVCEETMEAGQDLHPECVVAVTRCEDVSRASQGCDG